MNRVDPALLAAQIKAVADELASGILRGEHQVVLEKLQWLVGQVIILWRQDGWHPPPIDTQPADACPPPIPIDRDVRYRERHRRAPVVEVKPPSRGGRFS